MTDYLAKYKQYYQVRAEKFANNDNYKHSYEAEQNLSNAMQSCNELDEFRDKVGDFPDKCAIALVKDEYSMEQKHYLQYEEPFRKIASDHVLANVDNCTDVQAVVTLTLDANDLASKAIISDEYHREFIGNLGQLDDIEIYQKMEVPEKYKAGFLKSAMEAQNKMVEWTERNQIEFRKFIPDWLEKPETCLESRHRRLIPLNDEHTREQLAKYKTIINR